MHAKGSWSEIDMNSERGLYEGIREKQLLK